MPGIASAMDGCAEGVHADAHAADAHAAGKHTSPDGGDREHRCCTCFGPCCHAAAAVPAPAPSAMLVAAVRVVPPPARPQVVVSYRPTPPEHARPPSAGPPSGPAS